MNWLRYFLISTNARNMAYKRPSDRRFTVAFVIALISILITIALGLRGII